MLDSIIHAPNRLTICSVLATSAELEFRVLKEHLDVSDSVLSKQLKILEEASYIKLKKKREFNRPRTWVSLTKKGRKAFDIHVKALKDIVGSL